MSVTYFDYAATTPVSPQALEAVMEALPRLGNPPSRYPLGRAAAQGLKTHRATVARSLGWTPQERYVTIAVSTT